MSNYSGLHHLYNEKSINTIMTSLGENKSCLLTNHYKPSQSSGRLVIVTVDSVMDDPLYSNIACIDKSYCDNWMINVSYKLTCEAGTIHFRSPMDFHDFNKAALAKADFWDFNTLVGGFQKTDEHLVLFWEFLAQNHLKGIEQIDFLSHGVSIDQESMKFWRVRKRQSALSAPTSSIISL